MSETGRDALRVGFDRTVKLEFHGVKVVYHAWYVTVQLAETAVPRSLFAAVAARAGPA